MKAFLADMANAPDEYEMAEGEGLSRRFFTLKVAPVASGADGEPRCLLSLVDRTGEIQAERALRAEMLRDSLTGLEADWLQRLDATTPAALRNPALALTLGLALAERQLWGKARGMLLSAANDLQLDVNDRRTAWAQLGQMAERENRPEEAARFYRLAALPERD